MSFELFSATVSLFLLMDPIGNIPLFLASMRGIDPRRQQVIIARELVIALIIIFVFLFLGDKVLSSFHISSGSLSISAGIILFLISIPMILHKDTKGQESVTEEPFIVPLAIPYVAGPSLLGAIMIFAQRDFSVFELSFAVFISWSLTFFLLVFAPYLQKILKKKGIEACEKLMGLILTLIAVQMFMDGIREFVLSLR